MVVRIRLRTPLFHASWINKMYTDTKTFVGKVVIAPNEEYIDL